MERPLPAAPAARRPRASPPTHAILRGSAMTSGFALIEHTADVGFRAWGPTPEEALRQALRALAFVAFDAEAVAHRREWPIEVAGTDWPDLLVNFLGEVLYLFDTDRFAATDCRIDAASPRALRATLLGEVRDPVAIPWKLIVKAVTYHAVAFEPRAGLWQARVILDV